MPIRPGAGALNVATCPARAVTVPMAPRVSVNACGTTTTVFASTTGLASESLSDALPLQATAAHEGDGEQTHDWYS